MEACVVWCVSTVVYSLAFQALDLNLCTVDLALVEADFVTFRALTFVCVFLSRNFGSSPGLSKILLDFVG